MAFSAVPYRRGARCRDIVRAMRRLAALSLVCVMLLAACGEDATVTRTTTVKAPRASSVIAELRIASSAGRAVLLFPNLPWLGADGRAPRDGGQSLSKHLGEAQCRTGSPFGTDVTELHWPRLGLSAVLVDDDGERPATCSADTHVVGLYSNTGTLWVQARDASGTRRDLRTGTRLGQLFPDGAADTFPIDGGRTVAVLVNGTCQPDAGVVYPDPDGSTSTTGTGTTGSVPADAVVASVFVSLRPDPLPEDCP